MVKLVISRIDVPAPRVSVSTGLYAAAGRYPKRIARLQRDHRIRGLPLPDVGTINSPRFPHGIMGHLRDDIRTPASLAKIQNLRRRPPARSEHGKAANRHRENLKTGIPSERTRCSLRPLDLPCAAFPQPHAVLWKGLPEARQRRARDALEAERLTELRGAKRRNQTPNHI